ncbi:AmmeMemoRadiSam system protein B [Candidatus Woesearchaeota archaeon]|nr:AmmeMemoRadiSam system protein B [Candidatus Woesearchaeota archaeon]
MIRTPVVAGQFYEQDFSALSKQIEDCFKKPIKKRTKHLNAIIAPHAGYPFSGPTAAYAYKEIGESIFPDVFVILGLSHRGDETSVSYADWETPLGVLKNDTAFSKALKIPNNEKAHSFEHSIEVQLPFLQYANKDKLKEIRICPIIVNDNGIAEKIKKTALEQQKKIIVIASSDFTHYGPNFDYMPFVSNVKDNMHKLDNQAIQHILKLDIKAFQDYLDKTQATICGAKPIIALMEYMKLIGMKSSKLLHYTTSGDILNDFTNSVGYASIAFY